MRQVELREAVIVLECLHELQTAWPVDAVAAKPEAAQGGASLEQQGERRCAACWRGGAGVATRAGQSGLSPSRYAE